MKECDTAHVWIGVCYVYLCMWVYVYMSLSACMCAHVCVHCPAAKEPDGLEKRRKYFRSDSLKERKDLQLTES